MTVCEVYDGVERASRWCWINEHRTPDYGPLLAFVGCLAVWMAAELVIWAVRR